MMILSLPLPREGKEPEFLSSLLSKYLTTTCISMSVLIVSLYWCTSVHVNTVQNGDVSVPFRPG